MKPTMRTDASRILRGTTSPASVWRGFTDKYSWIGSHTHGARGAALLFDRAYKPKPAYAAMLEESAARPR